MCEVSVPFVSGGFMPNLNPTDQQLLQIVTAAQPVVIADVIQVMQSIDELLPNNDGSKWFNKLYLMVTQEIDGQPPPTAWSDPAWVTRLDVVFAGFYFAAIAGFLKDAPETPSSWVALFEARESANIDRIQSRACRPERAHQSRSSVSAHQDGHRDESAAVLAEPGT